MFKDVLNQFCNALALPTASTGYYNVGDVIPLSVARDIGRGKPSPYLVILVNTAVTSGSSATVQFILASDTVNPPRTDGTSETLHWTSAAIAKATLVAGYKLIVPIPLAIPSYSPFLGLQINVAVGALTGGTVTAFLTIDPSAYQSLPAAVYA